MLWSAVRITYIWEKPAVYNWRVGGFASNTLGVTLNYVRILQAVGCEMSFSSLCEAISGDTQQTSRQFVFVLTLDINMLLEYVSVRSELPTWLQCWKYCAGDCLWTLCHRLAKGMKICLMLRLEATVSPLGNKEWVFIGDFQLSIPLCFQ